MMSESSPRPDKIKKQPRKIFLYNKADKQHLRQNITNKNLCERYTKNLTTDEIWINFKEKVLKAIDETVPTKLINNTKKKLPCDERREARKDLGYFV